MNKKVFLITLIALVLVLSVFSISMTSAALKKTAGTTTTAKTTPLTITDTTGSQTAETGNIAGGEDVSYEIYNPTEGLIGQRLTTSFDNELNKIVESVRVDEITASGIFRNITVQRDAWIGGKVRARNLNVIGGKIGVGTENPISAIYVADSTNSETSIWVRSINTTPTRGTWTNNAVSIKAWAAGSNIHIKAYGDEYANESKRGNIELGSTASWADMIFSPGAEAMRITGYTNNSGGRIDGRVGIGTSTPDRNTRLDVNGSIRVNGPIKSSSGDVIIRLGR